MTARDYLDVVWRRKWLIFGIAAAATLLAWASAARQTPIYQASTTLMYETLIDMSNPASSVSGSVDSMQVARELEGVDTVVRSADIRDRVAQEMSAEGVPASSYSVSAAAGESISSGSTSVAIVSVTGPDPKVTALLANAYAKAFIDWRRERQVERIRAAAAVIQGRLRGYRSPALRNSSDYILLRQRLEDLEILQATVTGDFRIVAMAETPSSPIAPQPLRSAVLGFGVGLLAAIGLAFLLEQFDTRLSDYREAAELLHMPVLGRLPRVSKKTMRESPLTVVRQPGSRTAEAFRLLRGNLEFVNVDGDVHSFFVASALAGEGKSTTVANLGATLALGGKNVCVVDGDMRKPSLHRFFDVGNESGVSTVLTGQSSLADTMLDVPLAPHSYRGSDGRGRDATGEQPSATLHLLTAGPEPPNPGELVASKRFAELIDELEGMYDMVIVDSPAMLAVGDVAALSGAIDGVVMLVDFEAVRRPTLHEAADLLDPLPCRKLGVIAAREQVKRGEYYRYSYYRYSSEKTPTTT
jgi:Mrp family chromosome partitioning ATPase/capsular polysaccharide biosynthesis protein